MYLPEVLCNLLGSATILLEPFIGGGVVREFSLSSIGVDTGVVVGVDGVVIGVAGGGINSESEGFDFIPVDKH